MDTNQPLNFLRHTAFTLTEVLVTIAVIVMLAGILTPTLGKMRVRAREARALREMNILRDALVDYYAEYTTFPINEVVAGDTKQTGLSEGLVNDPKRFMGGLPDDPFSDTTYRYYSCDDGGTYADSCILFSLGPDKDDDGVNSFNTAFDSDGSWAKEYDRRYGKDGNVYIDHPIE